MEINTILESPGQVNISYLFLYVKALLCTFFGALNDCVGERTSNDTEMRYTFSFHPPSAFTIVAQ